MSDFEDFLWTSSSNDSSTSKNTTNMDQENDIKDSLLGLTNKLDSDDDGIKHTTKAKKRKIKEEDSHNFTVPEKKIKLEAPSDAESSKKKKKHKKEVHDSDIDNESYLKYRVKQEKTTKPKVEELSESHESQTQDVESSPKRKKKKKKHKKEKDYDQTTDVENTSEHFENGIEENHTETKKKKRHKDSILSNGSIDIGPTIINGHSHQENADADTSENSPGESTQSPQKPRRGTERLSVTFNDKEESSVLNSTAKIRRPRLSERIAFEDESSGAESALLRRYCRGRTLRSVEAAGPKPAEADTVWLVRAPRCLPPAELVGRALGSARVKVSGRTYEVSAGAAVCTALLTDAGLRLLRASRVLRLRRRPPRTPAPQVSAPAPSQPTPLPTTRVRHPLLGAEYSSALAQARKARRRRAKRADVTENELTTQEELAPEVVPTKRKRKASSSNRSSKKKRHRPDDWDSEKAIEENLFNF